MNAGDAVDFHALHTQRCKVALEEAGVQQLDAGGVPHVARLAIFQADVA